MKPDAALNLGSLLRDGVRLSTAEVVSILYDACRQLEAGASSALPKHPDNLWITDTGTVTLAAPDTTLSPRSAVASLLEILLPPASDEPAYAVPPPLRTLPDRLRASGSAAGGDYKDLLAILARYLPTEHKALLRQFVQRHSAGAAAPSDDAGDLLLDDTPETTTLSKTVVNPAATVTPARVERQRWPLAVTVMLLLLASGYLGYRYSPSVGTLDAGNTAATSEPTRSSKAPPTAPRIITSTASRLEAVPIVINTVRTQPLLLNAAEGAFSPSFGAGNTILFHTGRTANGRMLATRLDAHGRPSKTVALFDDGARNYHPRLSPDGQLLAFDSDRDGERGVYISRPDGTNRRRVSGDGYGAVPSWSPDGTRLAFIKAEPTRARVWNLWTLDLASGDLHRHSSFRSGQVWGASWFPDGGKVSYSHEDRLFVADLTTGELSSLRSPVPGRLVRTPAVSPDGRRILFQVFRDGVWVLDVKTRLMRRVLDDPTAEEFVWEPGGRRVAYHSRRDGQWRIWLMTI